MILINSKEKDGSNLWQCFINVITPHMVRLKVKHEDDLVGFGQWICNYVWWQTVIVKMLNKMMNNISRVQTVSKKTKHVHFITEHLEDDFSRWSWTRDTVSSSDSQTQTDFTFPQWCIKCFWTKTDQRRNVGPAALKTSCLIWSFQFIWR